MAPVITLTTDFGLSDHYVGAVKGSILSVNPEATIVDISHDIRPQDINQAAFLLGCAFGAFPRGSVHVAVVDPGVGSERRALALDTGDGVFIGPDNGVLSAALPDAARERAMGGAQLVPLPEGARGFLITNERFHGYPPSDTFHARSIFGPAAGHVSRGVAPAELGPEVREIVALPPFRGEEHGDGSVVGRIIHIDRFGNAITTVRGNQISSSGVRVEIAGRVVDDFVRTYSDSSTGLSALIGSCGFLEIALSGGSAANALGVQIGDCVVVRRA